MAAKEGDRIRLVSGYKRVLACGWLAKPVHVRFVSGEDLQKGRMYLHLNLDHQLTGSKLLACARFFQSELKQGAGVFLHDELCGVVPRQLIEHLQQWLCIEDSWDQGVHAGRVPFEAGSVLARLSPQDRKALAPFFNRLSWSWNKARNFLNRILESAKRDRLPVVTLLDQGRLFDLLEADLSPKDCQKQLLEGVYKIRYPVLTQLEQGFQRLQDDLGKKSGWRIEPEQHFEANGFFLRTRITQKADLDRALTQLQNLAEDACFDPVWKWQQENLD